MFCECHGYRRAALSFVLFGRLRGDLKRLNDPPQWRRCAAEHEDAGSIPPAAAAFQMEAENVYGKEGAETILFVAQ